MSTVKANNVQVGQSGTATNNFTLYQPTVPDGTVRLGNGNSGATTSDVITATSAGNVGIGTSSPSYPLHVVKNASGAQKVYFSNNSTNSAAETAFSVSNGTAEGSLRVAGTSYSGYGAYTANNTLLYNDTSAITIMADNATNGIIKFAAGSNAERARFTSDGFFKASNTGSYRNSGVACPEFNQSLNSDGLLVNVTNASYTNNALAVTATRNTTNNSFFAFSYYNDTAAAYRFRVADSGNATNTNGSYGAISDAKLKENVVDATPKLEKLTQVRIVNYNLIGEQQKQIGVIAQELEQIFPGMVEELPDRDAAGNDLGTTTKSVKYSVFVPMLIKAVQELTAKVEALEAKLAQTGA